MISKPELSHHKPRIAIALAAKSAYWTRGVDRGEVSRGRRRRTGLEAAGMS
jgi:hypothetical protein